MRRPKIRDFIDECEIPNCTVINLDSLDAVSYQNALNEYIDYLEEQLSNHGGQIIMEKSQSLLLDLGYDRTKVTYDLFNMSTIEYSSTEHDHELKIYIEAESVQSDDGILTAPEVRAIYVKMKELGCYDKK
jgi:hypothetical protein